MITPSTVFLVVDDAEMMRKVNCAQLTRLGAQTILQAKNGNEALAVLRAHNVDFILSDWSMPSMDGLGLLQEVRRDPTLAHLPFIMITAESERDQISQVIGAGVSSILIKPYTGKDLGRHLARAAVHRPKMTVSVPSLAAVAPLAATPVVDRRPTILVVDDVPDNLALIAGLFKTDYRVRVARDGQSALKICTSSSRPDLLLLDVMMPNMDGFELAEHLRSHPEASKIPIVFVTATSDPRAQERALELGAVSFVSKPIDPDALRQRVRNLLRHIEQHKSLQADYDAMLEGARLREDVAQISRHDIRGPLSGMLGLVQGLMDDADLLPRQTNTLRLVAENCQQLLEMIELSSEIYKIETGRFELLPKDVDLSALLQRIIETTRPLYSAKNVALELQMSDEVRQSLLAKGDPTLCYSLLTNLVKNAFEAAPSGTSVKLSVTDAHPIAITIENQPAVPASFRPNFFSKFATAGKTGGTGLGTYSAKLLAEAQKGSLQMEVDDLANSTRLTLRLPRAQGRQAHCA